MFFVFLIIIYSISKFCGFRFISNDDGCYQNYVDVQYNKVPTCNAELGYKGRVQTMNLGVNATLGEACLEHGIIIHEFLHALGKC